MAAIDDAAHLAILIDSAGLLGSALLRELAALRKRFPRAADLAGELVRRGWLTPYQSNVLLAGRAEELVLGSYVLLEPLGEGGMGQVFKARHRVMDRLVAIKLIRPEFLKDKGVISRFRRETRLAAKLNHPNVVLAHDALEVNGRHALVMEYVAGETLSQWVRRHGPLTPHYAADCARQAALGLDHAHAQGLIHRDVKPGNLLAADGVVKVADLGVARLTPDGPADSVATEDGQVLGTVDFLAPEQATDSRLTTARSDLYSLGCTLYFLLTGEVPFPGGSAVEKILRHRLEEPLPVTTLQPDVPAGLCEVVAKLMAKSPDDRYDSAADAAAALAKWCHAELSLPTLTELGPVVAAPLIPPSPIELPNDSTASEQNQPRFKRRALLGLFAVFACLTVTIALLVMDGRGGRTIREPDPAKKALRPEAPSPAVWVAGPVFGPMPDAVADVAFAPDGRSIAVACDNRLDPLAPSAVGLVPLADGKFAELGHHRAAVHRLAFTPRGDTLISVTGTDVGEKRLYGEVKFWNVRTPREDVARRIPDATSASVQALAIDREGKWFALASRFATLQMRQVANPESEPVRQFDQKFPITYSAVALSSAARYIAAGNTDGQAWVWRTDDPGLPILHATVTPADRAVVAGMAFLPNDEWVVWVAGASLRKWNLKRWEELKMPQNAINVTTISLGQGVVVRTALGPDGRTLATAWADSTIRLFDVTDGRLIQRLPGLTGSPTALAFSTDGRTLAAAGPDRMVRLWRFGQP